MAPKFQPPTCPTKNWYEANCHCGATRYKMYIGTLDGDSPLPINSCNCSICLKNGYLVAYPVRSEVIWHQGYDTLKKYQMSTKTKDHLFCGNCGSSLGVDFKGTMGEGPEEDRLAMNVRMIKDIDVDNLSLNKLNGKDDRFGVPYRTAN